MLWRGEIIIHIAHLSFIQHKTPKLTMSNLEITFVTQFDTGISIGDPK